MPAALEKLGYGSAHIEEIISYAVGHGSLGNAPGINHTSLIGHGFGPAEIEKIEAPFMVVFFILAGASLELMSLLEIGLMGFAFIVLRTLGKYLGARIGGVASGANQLTTEWIGPALLPQAGVAIGMALVASHHFEEDGHILLTIAIGSTIVFELIGPVITHIAIKRVGNQSR